MHTSVYMLIVLCSVATVSLGQTEPPSIPTIRYNESTEPALRGRVRTVLTVTTEEESIVSTLLDTYDSYGRKTESASFTLQDDGHGNRAIPDRILYLFSFHEKTKNLVKSTMSSSTMGISNTTMFVYDSNGRLKEEHFYSDDKRLFGKLLYEYDQSGLRITASNFLHFDGRDVIFGKRVFQRDRNGNVKRRIGFNKNDVKDEEIEYEYDKNGYLVKEVICCKYNYANSFFYVFDDRGNWIERTETYSQIDKIGVSSRPETKAFRIISYFTENTPVASIDK